MRRWHFHEINEKIGERRTKVYDILLMVFWGVLTITICNGILQIFFSEEQAAIVMFVALIASGVFIFSYWNEPIILQFRFDANIRQISADPMPNDCNFLTAPIGIKSCKYEPITNKQGDWLYVGWRRVAI